MKSKIGVIISREYILRVRKRGFIITTLLFPVFIVALMILPTLIEGAGSHTDRQITVIDESESVAPVMLTDGKLNYAFTTDPVDSILANPDRMPLLVMTDDIIDSPETSVIFYSTVTPSIETLTLLTSDIKEAVEQVRLINTGIPELKTVIDELEANPIVRTLTVNESGEIENSDTLSGLIIGIAMAFVLYMFLLIYGQIVMHSIIEEKNNRVLEIIVSSVKPVQLMIGKLVGVGAVAVTQVAIWGLIIVGFVKFGLPAIVGHEIVDNLDAIMSGQISPDAIGADMKIIKLLAIVSSLGTIMSMIGYLLIYLVGGFMLYASIYAAIGASVDNAQDGAQLQVFATIPVVISLMLSMAVGQDPSSSLAMWLSIIPFTSPMIMMMRIPSGVPAGEMILSIVILALSVAAMMYIAAKIYRVGIFMYGKKPTIKELIRWARYK